MVYFNIFLTYCLKYAALGNRYEMLAYTVVGILSRKTMLTVQSFIKSLNDCLALESGGSRVMLPPVSP